MAKKETSLALTDEQKALLDQSYPVGDESSRLLLPRLGLLSKDITEEKGTGKLKKINIINAAGEFYTEKDLGETDDDGKKKWTKTFIDGESIEVIIVYHRYQLRKFDSSLGKFISSPMYDNDTQVVPLYQDKRVIKRGTEKELQAFYPALTQQGKPTSDLKKDTILFVLYEGELHQLNLSQSSKWAFSSYKRGLNPSQVVTELGSKEETFGTNTYRKMTFKNLRPVSSTEFDEVYENQSKVRETVESDSRFYLGSGQTSEEDDKMNKEFEKM